MSNLFTDSQTQHTTTLTGLSGGLQVSVFYVQCAAYSSSPSLVLAYRSLPDSGNVPFPRLGNLWGSDNFRNHPEGLQYAAERATLWLGSDWSVTEIAELRSLNPFTLVFNSINACEVNIETLPDDFYLLNITQPPSTRGRLQSWPGAWRLDLTNPKVQQWQAALMYCLVVYGGTGYSSHPACTNATIPALPFDGLFVDNVFMDDGASVNSADIYGNPFYPINQTTGQIMDDFNEKWRAGMVNEISLFREMVPFGLLHGHAMDISDSNISSQFNAMSIGFTAPSMVEQRTSFSSGLSIYDDWMTKPTRSPKVTMVESAVRFQLGYGYGFDRDLSTLISPDCKNSNSIPGAPVPGNGDACTPTQPQTQGYIMPQTYMFARSEYQYMRFGLGFTLMRDGYFTHELGDSWHGMDWDYDELHFFLGASHGNATAAHVLSPPPPPVPPAVPLSPILWSIWIRSPTTDNASWVLDSTVLPPLTDAPPSARVDIQDNATPSENDGIDLSQIASYPAGNYKLSFWAKASSENVPLHLNSRKDGGDWHSFGLDVDVVLTTEWTLFNVTFISNSDGTPARMSWWLGSAPPATSIWINSPSLVGIYLPYPVYIREFDCGVVLLNGHIQNVTVDLGSASTTLRRLEGQQAPLFQYIVDDANSSSFHTITGTWAVKNYNSGYNDANPTSEIVRPTNGFFHHWAIGAHNAVGGSSASFDLNPQTPGLYNLSLWWPAAVPTRTSWATAMSLTINPGGLQQTTVDLTTQGGDIWFSIFSNVQLDSSSTLDIECPAGGGDCIADAVLIESIARWNDGTPTQQVSLQPMDAILLQRTVGAMPPQCSL